MPLFKDPYQTTTGRIITGIRAIETAIQEAIIKDNLNTVNLGVYPIGENQAIFVTGELLSENQIPPFIHPISIKNNHTNYVCSDLRLFVKKIDDYSTSSNVADRIRNSTEYNFAVSRAVLSLKWISGQTTELKTALIFAATVFSSWISETVAKAFALDYRDQTVLNILSHFYYQSLFLDKTEFDEDDRQRLAIHTIKATGAPSALVFSVFDKIDRIESIEDLCRLAITILENARLRNFNFPVLLTLLRNSWFAANAKEVLSVSLEHPPTWLAIVYTALSERTYKNSMLAKLAERLGKRGVSDSFMSSFGNMIREQKDRVSTEDITELDIRDFN